MYNKLGLIAILFLLGISFQSVFAQNSAQKVIAPAGDTFHNNSMELEWTVGEVAVTDIQNSSNIVTQGFHQPVFIISNVSNLPNQIGQINIFPNPTTNWIELKHDFKQDTKLTIQMFNQKGVLVWENNFQGASLFEKIEMSDLPAGNYFLTLKKVNTNLMQSYKIQKL